uniref:SPIN-DOC-like zinc-finger domain-containing protein n=1 Tax=Octopus bimaculoides TaxID=37653 RepID=A0A0L8GJB9_OCTBM
MSLSKRRKVDTEFRLFEEKWSFSYLFVAVSGKPVCLVCLQQVSVFKEYTIWCHYEIHHANKYNNLQGEDTKSFIAFLVAIDESTDITDVAQLAIFIHGVDKTLTVTEEFLELVPMMDTTTANDIFISFIGALDRAGMDWAYAVSVATDSIPSLIRKKAGVVMQFREKVRRLSQGAVLKRFFNLQEEIEQFIEKKGKPVLEFQSLGWLQDLAFIVDITEHLNNLNKMLQGRKTLSRSILKAYTQLSGGNPAHFPCLKDVVATTDNVDMNWYKDNIKGLLREFEQWFQIFDELETDFIVLCLRFTSMPLICPLTSNLK